MRALIMASASRETVISPCEHLGHEFLDQVLAAFCRRGIAGKAPFFHDLIEKRLFRGFGRSCGSGSLFHFGRHHSPPSVCLQPQFRP